MALFIGVREPSTEPGVDTVVRYRPYEPGVLLGVLASLVPDNGNDAVVILEKSEFPKGELARG